MKTISFHSWSAGFLGVLLSLAGCSESQEPLTEGRESNLMTFCIEHPGASGHTRATSTAFEANDRIGLFITGKGLPLEQSGNYVNNAALTFNGNRWNPDKPIYWDNGSYDVYAYFPHTTPLPSVDDAPFSVSLDQQADGGYEASDFLWAGQKGVTASNGDVQLQFRHRMSRLLIKLVRGEEYEGDDIPEDAEVYIHNTVPDFTVDMSVGVATRHPHATARSIRARNLGNHQYAAIIVPQRLDNRQPLVEVIMKGVSYLYESKFLFKPGIQHSVQLAISKNPEQIKIEIGGEVEKWD